MVLSPEPTDSNLFILMYSSHLQYSKEYNSCHLKWKEKNKLDSCNLGQFSKHSNIFIDEHSTKEWWIEEQHENQWTVGAVVFYVQCYSYLKMVIYISSLVG